MFGAWPSNSCCCAYTLSQLLFLQSPGNFTTLPQVSGAWLQDPCVNIYNNDGADDFPAVVTADISLYNDAPTTTEFVRFDRSAYQLPGEAKSPYEGFPTLANDAAWEELTNGKYKYTSGPDMSVQG